MNTGKQVGLFLFVLLTLSSLPLYGQTLAAQPEQTVTVVSGAPVSTGVERVVQFPSDGLVVPGTLTLPSIHAAKIPIVVSVQGSGVQDCDATIGVNKVFRDLAFSLADRGIATLRYDRRPKFALANFKS